MRGYLDPEDADRNALDRRRAQLAAQLAELFDEYAYSRPEMLAAWRKGGLIAGWDEPLQRWQRDLWLALFGRGGTLVGPRHARRCPTSSRARRPTRCACAGPAHVFGISFVARLYRSIFASLGRAASLFVYTLNPAASCGRTCSRCGESAPQARARRRGDAQLALELGDDAAAAPRPAAADENPLLALWGRPGRDSIRLYNDLSDCDFHERFEDPAAGMARPRCWPRCSARSWSARRAAAMPAQARRSLVMFGAPDPRRELETVAAEIWSLVRRDATLRFDDFAVVVPAASSATYLPLAREVFAAASELPHTVLDLPSPAEGHVLDGGRAAAGACRPGRSAAAICCSSRCTPRSPADFPTSIRRRSSALCEQLAIVRGADGGDLAGSYADEDRVSWDQGLRRLALGAFLSGRRSGEERPFSFDGEAGAGRRAARRRRAGRPRARACIARELIDFARTARGADGAGRARSWRCCGARSRRPSARPAPTSRRRWATASRCWNGSRRRRPPIWRSASASRPSWCARAWRRARGASRAPEGVAVADVRAAARAAVPDRVRARPRRAGVSVGRGVRRARSARRAPAPQPGDVTPREQDEYVFLETLLSARERLYLSYVARDAATGERKDPSSTLLALRDVLGAGAARRELLRGITRPTRRWRATATTPSAR